MLFSYPVLYLLTPEGVLALFLETPDLLSNTRKYFCLKKFKKRVFSNLKVVNVLFKLAVLNARYKSKPKNEKGGHIMVLFEDNRDFLSENDIWRIGVFWEILQNLCCLTVLIQ